MIRPFLVASSDNGRPGTIESPIKVNLITPSQSCGALKNIAPDKPAWLTRTTAELILQPFNYILTSSTVATLS
jgi:hypothetical protein